jgi:hypothetical protein
MHKNRFYRIQVAVALTAQDATWFEDLAMDPSSDQGTVLLTPAIDQTALHGILATLRDLAIPLVSVEPMDRPPEWRGADFPTTPLREL